MHFDLFVLYCYLLFSRTYCPLGSSGATPCPGGTYGSTVGSETSACTDICPIGYSTFVFVFCRVLPQYFYHDGMVPEIFVRWVQVCSPHVPLALTVV